MQYGPAAAVAKNVCIDIGDRTCRYVQHAVAPGRPDGERAAGRDAAHKVRGTPTLGRRTRAGGEGP
eukprot:6670777-Prymnesium_polylepis.2